VNFKIWLENELQPFIAYHQTTLDNSKKIRKNGFSLKKSTQGIIWFTTDADSIKNNTTGASINGPSAVLKVLVDIKNPAGWKEYDELMLAQLKSMGYDGVILPNNSGTFDGFVFNPKNIKVIP
jgi:hypothetical protein